MNRAFAASSLAPTSFIAPSSYCKLRGVRTFTGGRFSSCATVERHQRLTESSNSRVIGSRFLEVKRNQSLMVDFLREAMSRSKNQVNWARPWTKATGYRLFLTPDFLDLITDRQCMTKCRLMSMVLCRSQKKPTEIGLI